MKKNRLLVTALLGGGFLAASPLLAQDQTIKLVTSKPVGQEVSFMVNKVSVPITVDWGNGTPVEVALEGEGLVDVKGTLAGNTITITVGQGVNTLACPDMGLTSIDVSAAPSLHSLYCQNNELTELDITALTNLTDLNAANNKLTTLELTDALYPQLENLNIAGNELSGRFNLNNEGLQQLNISDNNFTQMYLTYNGNIDGVKCGGNQLTSINLLRNASISSLLCDGNALTGLTFVSAASGGMPNLYALVCDDNALKRLDLSNCSALEAVSCGNNELTELSLPSQRLRSLDCTENYLGFTSLPATNKKPETLNFAPQKPIDITDGLDPYGDGYALLVCPSYADAENEKYQLDLDDQYQALVTFTWYSIAEDGTKTKLTAATASREGDFRKMQGRFAFFREFDRISAELTHISYPGIVLTTNEIAVVNDLNGIDGITTADCGLVVTAENGAIHMVCTAASPANARIVSLDGKTVWTGTVSEGGVSVNLPKGVYIVNGKKYIL